MVPLCLGTVSTASLREYGPYSEYIKGTSGGYNLRGTSLNPLTAAIFVRLHLASLHSLPGSLDI